MANDRSFSIILSQILFITNGNGERLWQRELSVHLTLSIVTFLSPYLTQASEQYIE